MDSEQYEELQNLLTKSREDEKNIKNELNTLQQTLADEKQKSEESLALVKQKEEDIKVRIFTRINPLARLPSQRLRFNEFILGDGDEISFLFGKSSFRY